jgi:hypothetical protein
MDHAERGLGYPKEEGKKLVSNYQNCRRKLKPGFASEGQVTGNMVHRFFEMAD